MMTKPESVLVALCALIPGCFNPTIWPSCRQRLAASTKRLRSLSIVGWSFERTPSTGSLYGSSCLLEARPNSMAHCSSYLVSSRISPSTGSVTSMQPGSTGGLSVEARRDGSGGLNS